MYIFSVNAKAKKDRDGVKEGQVVPFIVYINFIDLFGAEQLCKVYLMRAGFTEIEIEKRKLVPSNLTGDPRVVAADKAMAEAIKTARKARSCLMCCCPDWQFCHRKCVVDAISKLTTFAVEHIERTEQRVIVRKAG